MARTGPFAARLAVAILVCSPAWAFQASAVDAAVSIVPHFRPAVATVQGLLPRADIRVDSSLVQVPAQVTNVVGAPITDLRKEDFHVFEDGVEQPITNFSREDAPLSIGLLFDVSGSMRNKIKKATEAAEEFFKTSNPQDEFFLIEFSDRPKLKVPFTSDPSEIYDEIAHTKPFGRTSLLDAIHLGMDTMRQARNLRKALVIVSDGGDNRSRHTAREVKNAMLESDLQVYAMGIFDPEDAPKHSIEEQNGPKLLTDLADQSGGREYPVENLDELPVISARIGNLLRNQYLIGYSPLNAIRDGKYRKIQVRVTPETETRDLRVYYRRGYYSPGL
ncbi:MAG TPA: VWA domain-containing protein [Bryobacteraceae bacterium]|nr:VWA domain-containing protein [Bryobacteraceae bacterium]